MIGKAFCPWCKSYFFRIVGIVKTSEGEMELIGECHLCGGCGKTTVTSEQWNPGRLTAEPQATPPPTVSKKEESAIFFTIEEMCSYSGVFEESEKAGLFMEIAEGWRLKCQNEQNGVKNLPEG